MTLRGITITMLIGFMILLLPLQLLAAPVPVGSAIGERQSAFYGGKSAFQNECIGPDKRVGDYLKDVHSPVAADDMNSWIFVHSVTQEMNDRYHGFNDPFLARQPYGLNAHYDYLNYNNQSRELVDWTMRRLFEYHVDHFVSDPPKHSQTIVSVSNTVKTVQAIQNTKIEINPETKAKFRFDLTNSLVRMNFNSPLFNSEATFRSRPLNPLIRSHMPDEMLSVSAYKSIDLLSLSTSVSYGVKNENLSYGASKKIIGPVQAHIFQNHFIRNIERDELIYKLTLGTEFPF